LLVEGLKPASVGASKKKKHKQSSYMVGDDVVVLENEEDEDEDDSSYKPSHASVAKEQDDVSVLSFGGVSKAVDECFMYSKAKQQGCTFSPEPTSTPATCNKSNSMYGPASPWVPLHTLPKTPEVTCTAGHYAGNDMTDALNSYIYFRPPPVVAPIEVKFPYLQDRWHDARGNDRLTLSFHLPSGICKANGCITADGTKFQLWFPMSDKI
jgi:hypothetical protein